MTEYCRNQIGKYMENYLDVFEGYTYSDEDIINLGIGELIRNDNFSPLELQRDILRKCSVFLPMDYILDYVQNAKD